MMFDPLSFSSPILLKGDATTAFRDPAVFYHDGFFHFVVPAFCDFQEESSPQVVSPCCPQCSFWYCLGLT